MKGPILIIKSLLISTIGFTQCEYIWQQSYKGSIDTIVIEQNFFKRYGANLKRYNLSLLHDSVKKSRLDSLSYLNLKFELDSLLQLNLDLNNEVISFLNHEINSQFQIISIDSVEFALYAMDTITIEEEEIVIYAYSSNLKTEWNEDNNNWFFYYTKRFGTISAEFHCFTENYYPCFLRLDLIKNCLVDSTNVNKLAFIKNYLEKNRYRE